LIIKILWFCCLKSKFEFAAELIRAGIDAVQGGMGCMFALFSAVIIFLQAGVLAAAVGAFHYTSSPAPGGGEDSPDLSEDPTADPTAAIFGVGFTPKGPVWTAFVVFATIWALETLANILHVTICCCVGSHCGVRTPSTSACGAMCFAMTSGLGSIVFGSFFIALLAAVAYLYEKGSESRNPCVRVIVLAVLGALAYIIKIYNAFAFVFVGLKGHSYLGAAGQMMDLISKDGNTAIATDEALHDVIRMCKMVGVSVLVLVALACGYEYSIVHDFWLICICCLIGVVVAFTFLTTFGRVLEASVCTVFVVFEEYPRQMQGANAELCDTLKAMVKPDKDEGGCC